MYRRLLLLSIAFAACSSRERAQPAEPPIVTVSLAEFQQLHWLVGTWRGSGGTYPAFFEEYRVVDDSTMQMRSLTDSTLSVTSDSSWIEWRNGAIRNRSGERVSVALEFTASTVRFGQPGVPSGGFTFTRTSADDWTATLHPARPDGQPTVYSMRRLPR